ncbi:16S rRNA (guanine(527)-N(7))-methyltransferase RsmG [Coralloluteibacterium stylophorae]|uniref:Ribosomal RNA small subunit methyltransferase G n=1 Tax=Coralloluteibacterium stylophorae TaxID=1776034 RepID=A0A8J7VRJ0_9GAMM|nr:16S rRNA (guanine(527)-N(7))-methyltransferase RsmG [Coralloluteibacterium stylophorae]MBS7457073.1 16S rRNA (guanine(527)-N(7))-methyltransferase RsmG [Coralloluteibacterium stylophorae]
MTATADLQPELEAGLDALGIDRAHAPRLLAYLALLARWNATYNLTAVRDPREMVTRHLLDSLSFHAFVPDGALVDIGTGPGLPGIPLAIVRPGVDVTLVESNGKKTRFMRQALRELGLANARVAESRAESLPRSGAFGCLVARALGTLAELVRVGGHLIAPGGRLLAMKGRHPDDEIAALPEGWQVAAAHRLAVPGLDAERHLVVLTRLNDRTNQDQ